MQRLSRRRGVISVFLLLIFMVSYVFMGMLVDAGRYRIAEAYAEASLDAASSSVLANYNQLMFDLYGLLSLDVDVKDNAELTKKIEELYVHYLEETLGLVDTKVDDYRTVLVDSIFNFEDTSLGMKQLYDFQIGHMDAGTKVTLADTANVESQIIDYMKFRAPVTLVSDMDGFLKKLDAMVGMTDRINKSIKLAEITEKYEEPKDGSAPLSEQAQYLLREIERYVIKMYIFSINSAIKPTDLQNNSSVMLGNDNPTKIADYFKEFDEELKKKKDEYVQRKENEDAQYASILSGLLGDLRNQILDSLKKNDNKVPDIKLGVFYPAEGTEEKTEYFTRIDLDALNETQGTKIAEYIRLAGNIYEKISGKDDIEAYVDFCTKYSEQKKEHESIVNGEDYNLSSVYKEVVDDLLEKIGNIEQNAAYLYEEANIIRDKLNQVVGLYQSYISDMEKEKGTPGNENRETVYSPAIELAQANTAELLKNLEILMNSRFYLNEIGYGFKSDSGEAKMKLSEILPGITGKILSVHEDFYQDGTNPSEEDKKYLLNTPLQNELSKSAEAKWKNSKAAEGMYKSAYEAVYAASARQCVSGLQGNICVINSFTSYYRKSFYRRNVDVKIDDIGNMETQNAKDKVNGSDNKKDAALKLDNEAMLKAADYPDYLKVEYEHSIADTGEEIGTQYEMDKKVRVSTMTKILKQGLKVLKALGDLLETARDNLYIDAYIMTMLPNYYDYNMYNSGKKDEISSVAFSNEYLKYNASFASVEYIITGVNEKNLKPAKEEGEMAKGFGQLSVESMRARLFGTRMLFNGVAMFTDTAKYSQASVMCSWLGPAAPLATIVMMAAWAVAETVIDVMILMGDDIGFLGNAVREDRKIPVFKQGADWFFSLEGVAGKLGELAVNTLVKEIEDEAAKLTNTVKNEFNLMIYKAYTAASGSTAAILNEVKATGSSTLKEWGNEMEENIRQLPSSTPGQAEAAELAKQFADLGNSFEKEIDSLKEKADTMMGDARDNAVIMVNRASEAVIDNVNKTVNSAGESAKKFLKQNINSVIPLGEVVNTGKTTDVNFMMGYKDYLYFFLFLTGNTKKVERIQSVLQANMRVGGNEGFCMKNSPVSIWADMECSIKYLFLSNGLIPQNMKKNGRLRIKVISAQSY